MIKEIQGYTIESEKLNLKQGKYEVKFKQIEPSPVKKIKIMSIASYADRDRDMIDFLESERKRFETKLQSKDILETLPFK